MLSASSTVMPWPLGGHSHTRMPRYVVEIGSSHVDSCDARSASVKTPPLRCTTPAIAAVERIAAALGHRAQRAREVGVAKRLAGARRAAVDRQLGEVGGGLAQLG